ncbi:uncharacterized protein LOC131434073 [Malaya genurostris]|uniref:uncharacterized protein LOC131434073 n=1 Tax=Malaya genurostris TaxID=325434 RepID=UPI0026F3B0FF|nr:uncharacterized protein LOC131434073 [Malaya genurostris]
MQTHPFGHLRVAILDSFPGARRPLRLAGTISPSRRHWFRSIRLKRSQLTVKWLDDVDCLSQTLDHQTSSTMIFLLEPCRSRRIALSCLAAALHTLCEDGPVDAHVGDDVDAGAPTGLALDAKIQDFGFTIRAEKCTFGKKQTPYLGYIVDHRGLRSDPAEIKAIVQLPPPTDVHGSKFQWTTECQQTFERFKQILTTRALTKAEQNYSQPDREGLAIISALTKFHKMIFGRRFLLQTDAPLLRIFGSKKGIPVYTANQLQRFALTLLLYDFTIEYVPTDKFGNTDVLSRLINQHARLEEDYAIASIILEQDVRSVAGDTVDALPLTFRNVARSTQTDPVLRKAYRFITDGWPQTKAIDSELKRFQVRQESLTTVDGCILFAEWVVIPAQYRKRCLDQLHNGHQYGGHRQELRLWAINRRRHRRLCRNLSALCIGCQVTASRPPSAMTEGIGPLAACSRRLRRSH